MAPAGGGKTEFALALARETAGARVCVSSQLQLRAWSRRWLTAGGEPALSLFTFDGLVLACLEAAGETVMAVNEAVQRRLLRLIVATLPLHHYAPLVERGGFTRILLERIREFKAGRITPQALAAAISRLGNEARLAEVAQIYAAYQEQLQQRGWADTEGLAWLAVESLESRAAKAGRDWPLLIIDGFDNFTPLQLSLIQVLAGRVGRLVVTLTDLPGDLPRYPRFRQTRQQLESLLGIQAQPLATAPADRPLRALAALLFDQRPKTKDQRAMTNAPTVLGPSSLVLLEAPDRPAEVRAALRWLKERLKHDGMRPAEVALLARDLPPYRPFIVQVAAEFGLPVRVVEGLPLGSNPAVAALLNLLRLALPDAAGRPSLPRRLFIDAWRSPYFDWLAGGEPGESAIGIRPGDADKLDAMARAGRVLGGLEQWRAALQLAARATPDAADEDEGWGASLPIVGEQVAALDRRFERFVQRINPLSDLAGLGSLPGLTDFAAWLERLVAFDAEPAKDLGLTTNDQPSSFVLGLSSLVSESDPADAARDRAALRTLRELLHGLVEAEAAAGTGRPMTFARFFAELVGAVEASTYQLPPSSGEDVIMAVNAIQARGLPFRAVAVLGLAEGEFPAVLGEDPFLRDADRAALRQLGLPLEPSTQSYEREYFYETISRAGEQLLLTRSRLADNGAEWLPSPFWDEVQRLTAVVPVTQSGDTPRPPQEAASMPELLESLAAHWNDDARRWLAQAAPERLAALLAAAQVLRGRQRYQPPAGSEPAGGSASVYDGDLGQKTEQLAQHFGPQHAWGVSRLERYRACNYLFFVDTVLKLEARPEPAEGADARQLGATYHRIFEAVYRDERSHRPLDQAQAGALVREIAAPILASAPAREGFRETPWWAQTCEEIMTLVTRSVLKLAELPGAFRPIQTEVRFFSQQALVLHDGDDWFQVQGVIDRIDRGPDGRLRLIDYKLGGPSSFSTKEVMTGKKLQLPLYALAAETVLGLGEVADGFYWHFRQGQPSPFALADVEGGSTAAAAAAVAQAWTVVRAVRAGHFTPEPPAGGCPAYCPAAAFCWHYRPRMTK